MVQWSKKNNLISVFQLLCINRKHNFFRYVKITQLCREQMEENYPIWEIVVNFIRLYLVSLPPYHQTNDLKYRNSQNILNWLIQFYLHGKRNKQEYHSNEFRNSK
jgi:hypothetical protein